MTQRQRFKTNLQLCNATHFSLIVRQSTLESITPPLTPVCPARARGEGRLCREVRRLEGMACCHWRKRARHRQGLAVLTCRRGRKEKRRRASCCCQGAAALTRFLRRQRFLFSDFLPRNRWQYPPNVSRGH